MNPLKLVPLALLLLTAFPTTDLMAQNGRGRREIRIGDLKYSGITLTVEEQQALILMREEEKLARDVYTALRAKWGENVFNNIAQAESRHLNAVGNLLSRYSIPDPITNDSAGVFTEPRFQQLYRSLTTDGSKSLEDGLKAGLRIEEMDIADLREAIHATDNQDIARTLQNLLRGSENHLRAFASRLNAVGGTYVATSLPQWDFDKIANSRQEAGRGNGQRGGGGQQGRGQRGRDRR